MSLDVYIAGKPFTGSGIFVRRNGSTVELTREQWDSEYPGQEPCGAVMDRNSYSANITHNLGKMAGEAGLYELLWRPDEIGITKAEQLILPLVSGLKRLQAEPDRFRAFNPANGWGDYEGLVKFVQNYLLACIANPDGEVSVSR